MALPSYNELAKEFLDYIKDGRLHTLTEIKGYLKNFFDLNDIEIYKKEVNKKFSEFDEIINNIVDYLKRKDLIYNPLKDIFTITIYGIYEVKNKVNIMDNSYIEELNKIKLLNEINYIKELQYLKKNNLDNMLNEIQNYFDDLLKQRIVSYLRNINKEFFIKIIINILNNKDYIYVDVVDDFVLIFRKTFSLDELYIFFSINSFYESMFNEFIENYSVNNIMYFTNIEVVEHKKKLYKDVKIVDINDLLDLILNFKIGISSKKSLIINEFDETYFI